MKRKRTEESSHGKSEDYQKPLKRLKPNSSFQEGVNVMNWSDDIILKYCTTIEKNEKKHEIFEKVYEFLMSNERESMGKRKLIMLLKVLFKQNLIEKRNGFIKMVVQMMMREPSHATKGELLQLLLDAVENWNNSIEEVKPIMGMLQDLLMYDWDANIRLKYIKLNTIVKEKDTKVNVEKWLSNLKDIAVGDGDPRVRAGALGCIKRLLQFKCPQHVISASINLLTDDFPEVRIESMRMLVSTNQSQDDLFILYCKMLQDVDTMVRAEACKLMGKLSNVSPHLLFSTFDKLKLNFNPHQLSNWNEVTNVIENEYEKNLLDTNEREVGAFVLALEDEFMIVRDRAIESICSLSKENEHFRKLSIDFVLEMFNDDIDKVRLTAIRAIKQLCIKTCLSMEQVRIPIVLLEDGNHDIRSEIRELFKHMKVISPLAMYSIIMALLNTNMKKYPADTDDILETLAKLSQNHPTFLVYIYQMLLHIERFIERQHSSLSDTKYIGSMVVLFNSMNHASNLKLLHSIPTHILNDYHTLHQLYPNLFPTISNIQEYQKKKPFVQGVEIEKEESQHKIENIETIQKETIKTHLENVIKLISTASIQDAQNSLKRLINSLSSMLVNVSPVLYILKSIQCQLEHQKNEHNSSFLLEKQRQVADLLVIHGGKEWSPVRDFLIDASETPSMYIKELIEKIDSKNINISKIQATIIHPCSNVEGIRKQNHIIPFVFDLGMNISNIRNDIKSFLRILVLLPDQHQVFFNLNSLSHTKLSLQLNPWKSSGIIKIYIVVHRSYIDPTLSGCILLSRPTSLRLFPRSN